jgi:hypothetical protein
MRILLEVALRRRKSYRSVVLGVREKDNPFITNELVKVDGAIGSLSVKVGGSAAEAKGSGVGHVYWWILW